MDLQLLLSIFQNIPFLTAYINNNRTFPKHMSEEEEKYYIEQFFKGDEKAKNILIERNLRLVAHIAKKYENSYRDKEDLISMGTVGLIKAVDSFKTDRGTRLGTYAAKCIENEILMLIRSSKKSKNDVSLNDTVGCEKEGRDALLIEVLVSEEETILDLIEIKIQMDNLKQKIEKVLTEREKFVINSRYGLINQTPITQKEVAKKMNISRSYVSRIEKKAIFKLSKVLNDNI